MSPAVLVPWLVAAALLAVAVLLAVRARGADRAAAAAAGALRGLESELASERERRESAEARRRRAGEELGELRHKLDKAKKRAARATRTPGEPGGSEAPELQRSIEAVRQERDAARIEARRLADEVSELRSTVRRQREEKPLLDNPAIVALQRDLAVHEGEAARLRKELADAAKEAERLRAKARTNEQLYVAIRGELQAKKDRLRAQTEELERLRSLEVVLGRGDE